MSNYHVLESQPGDEAWAEVAFHIAIPDQNNFAKINLRQAAKERQEIEANKKMGFEYTRVPWLKDKHLKELQDIKNGLIIEHVEKVDLSNATNLTQRRDKLDERYNELFISITDKIKRELEFWGYDRDIP